MTERSRQVTAWLGGSGRVGQQRPPAIGPSPAGPAQVRSVPVGSAPAEGR
jgi:hypothetical protein